MKHDRNFDSLIAKFEQKIYRHVKGDWRLKLIKEDLAHFHQSPKHLAIWDAGCGFGQISLWLAGQGHQLALCDISEKMLARAREQFRNAGLTALFHQQAAQVLAAQLPQFDLILSHALLEWLAQPVPTLQIIAERVKPGGYLSLLFYNRNAMVYTNALKGRWRWKNLLNDSYLGQGKKLTPPNPQYPHELIEHLQQWGFSIEQHTGIRVFHDYIAQDTLAQSDPSELFALEYRYCRMPTYRDMGRYVHLLAKRQGTAL
ncbi:MAG: SAM-dependent methyltransferase [Gammaproteobacteria bacterium HGW-Gammaproteobacteria-3]|nr:MAG: SAM-dependent methyltransferase [Gammaproteobacteria bacterium HGW-Gammaproteobacteria-3]